MENRHNAAKEVVATKLQVAAPVMKLTEVMKTESARTSSSFWTKLYTKIIYTLLLVHISYQMKLFLTIKLTPNIENQFRNGSSTEFHLIA